MSEKLLPCPFCGGDDLRVGTRSVENATGYRYAEYRIDHVPHLRQTCGASVTGETLDEVRAAWNKRAQPEGWQPIETAPKDGTEILLYAPALIFENGNPVDARVTIGQWVIDDGYIRERRDLNGRYIDQDESDGFEGWMSWDGGFSEENPPTCWMPLPSAPIAAAPQAKEG